MTLPYYWLVTRKIIIENFWQQLSNPIIALAPMEEVTDTVFREIVLSRMDPGNLNILYTEFVNTDGLCHPVGREKVAHRLQISESEKKLLKNSGVKIIAQIWGAKPEKYYEAVKIICAENNFHGIDINMGCPVPKIIKQGSCSKLITNPALAAEIIQATKEATELPVSVKTRIGFKEIETEKWISHLLQQDVSAIIIHGRTQKMMSEGLADWNEIGKAVKIRDQFNKNTKIIGNGDVKTFAEIDEKCTRHGVDGVMIGRGIFHNPWLFKNREFKPSVDERFKMLWEHATLFDKTWGETKNFNQLRRFFKIYLNGFDSAAPLRASLMEAKDLANVRELLINWGTTLPEIVDYRSTKQ